MTISSARTAGRLGGLISPAGLGKLALFIALLTAGLAAYGAWVRVSGSGLGCPDWPLCNKAVVPNDRAAAIESGHRWFAGIILLLVLAAAGLGFLHRGQYPRASRLLIAAAALILGQALLGAVVVLTELHALSVLAHLALAMGVIALTTTAGIGLMRGEDPGLRLKRPGWHLVAAAAVLIMIGGSIIATDTTFQCPGIPVCDGSSPGTATALHDLHRGVGVIVLLGAAFMAFRHWRRGETGPVFRTLTAVTVLLIVQISVGFAAIALDVPGELSILHVGIASMIWMGMVALWSFSRPTTGTKLSPTR